MTRRATHVTQLCVESPQIRACVRILFVMDLRITQRFKKASDKDLPPPQSVIVYPGHTSIWRRLSQSHSFHTRSNHMVSAITHSARTIIGVATLGLFCTVTGVLWASGGSGPLPGNCSCTTSPHACGTATGCSTIPASCDCCRNGTGTRFCTCCDADFDCANPPSGWQCG